ncbi:MAG TPA: hypothetical protein DDX19_14480 [Rhodopirellula baltica]|nr:hypothetical protein [Rhodopirellula baltica]
MRREPPGEEPEGSRPAATLCEGSLNATRRELPRASS